MSPSSVKPSSISLTALWWSALRITRRCSARTFFLKSLSDLGPSSLTLAFVGNLVRMNQSLPRLSLSRIDVRPLVSSRCIFGIILILRRSPSALHGPPWNV